MDYKFTISGKTIDTGSYVEINLSIASLEEKAANSLIILQKSKTILKEDTEAHFGYRWLYDKYQESNKRKLNVVSKSIVSVLNAIIFQQRLVFGMTRDLLRELLSNDENWQKRIGLKHENYKKIIGRLVKSGLIEEVKYDKDEEKKVKLYRVIHPEILKALTGDFESQLSESLKFVLKTAEERKSSSNEGDNRTKRIPEDLTDYQVKYNDTWFSLASMTSLRGRRNNPELAKEIKDLETQQVKLHEEMSRLADEGKDDTKQYDTCWDKIRALSDKAENLEHELKYKEYTDNPHLYLKEGGRVWDAEDRKRERDSRKAKRDEEKRERALNGRKKLIDSLRASQN